VWFCLSIYILAILSCLLDLYSQSAAVLRGISPTRHINSFKTLQTRLAPFADVRFFRDRMVLLITEPITEPASDLSTW